jgi:hypothetical protein
MRGISGVSFCHDVFDSTVGYPTGLTNLPVNFIGVLLPRKGNDVLSPADLMTNGVYDPGKWDQPGVKFYRDVQHRSGSGTTKIYWYEAALMVSPHVIPEELRPLHKEAMRNLIESGGLNGNEGTLLRLGNGMVFFKVRIWAPCSHEFQQLKASPEWCSVMNKQRPTCMPVTILKNFIFQKVLNNARTRILSSQNRGYDKSEIVMVGDLGGNQGGSFKLINQDVFERIVPAIASEHDV